MLLRAKFLLLSFKTIPRCYFASLHYINAGLSMITCEENYHKITILFNTLSIMIMLILFMLLNRRYIIYI